MSTARSVFTEAIEEHLALKKQNLHLEVSMPLARYDVGDPIDRYPGGRGNAETGTVVVADQTVVPDQPLADADATHLFAGPSPEQAMEAATALETSYAGQPFEPLGGMTPMLSLVEDIEEDEDLAGTTGETSIPNGGDVLRFPGGVGPREDAPAAEVTGSFDQVVVETTTTTVTATSIEGQTSFDSIAAPEPMFEDVMVTGEQPVLVIDADEPFGAADVAPAAAPDRDARRKPRFFGMGRKKSNKANEGDAWFTDGPRDFNWD